MAYTAGTGGTLKSTTAENALIELLTYISDKSVEQDRENPIQMSVDIASSKVTFSGDLAVSVTLDSNGKPVIDAVDILT